MATAFNELENLTLGEHPRSVQGFVWEVRFVTEGSVPDALSQIREAWRVIASWGTYADEAVWPDEIMLLRQLPTWLVDKLRSNRVHVSDWLQSIYDRDWIWLSSRQSGQETVVCLLANSLPLSTWSLREVVEAIGGSIVKDDVGKK